MASSTPSMSHLLKLVFALDFEHKLTSWYCWVPSESNPADAPSRLQTSELAGMGVIRDFISDDILTKLASEAPSFPYQ
eukprot:3933975-Amphidinium_carterae.1